MKTKWTHMNDGLPEINRTVIAEEKFTGIVEELWHTKNPYSKDSSFFHTPDGNRAFRREDILKWRYKYTDPGLDPAQPGNWE